MIKYKKKSSNETALANNDREISLEIIDVYPDGSIIIFYSEDLILMKELEKVNVTSNFTDLLNITYFSKMDIDDPHRPILINWNITELSSNQLNLKLNFKNELYVSSM